MGMEKTMRMLGILLTLFLFAASACRGDEETAGNGDAVPSGDEVPRVHQILFEIPAPGESVTGLASGGGFLWAVDSENSCVFRLDPESGEVLQTFTCDFPPGYRTTGLAYSETQELIMVGAWDYGYNGYVFQYTEAGEYVSSASMCGG
jgi:hypothetical protein